VPWYVPSHSRRAIEKQNPLHRCKSCTRIIAATSLL
jgi:hypothetical protein